MAYSKLIQNISISIEAQLNLISTRYNFDNGDEFEVGLCELITDILPSKYGVCRGFVVTEDDSFAGDDIIIYDRERFPTLRILGNRNFQGKQEIPVEAVYCYIEAKHTLVLTGNEPVQNFSKAFLQAHKVKSLKREKRQLGSLDPYNVLVDHYPTNLGNWPDYDNPMFTAIISRFVKEESGQSKDDANIAEVFKNCKIPYDSFYPDLIVLGERGLMFPVISNDGKIVYDSPFFIPGKSNLLHKRTSSSALAVGLTMLMYALDTIKLGKMPYKKIINHQLR